MPRRTTRSSGDPTAWILTGLVLVTMVPVHGCVRWTGLWDRPDGYGHHSWGVFVFAVLVPSIVIVVGAYDLYGHVRRRRRR